MSSPLLSCRGVGRELDVYEQLNKSGLREV